MKNNNNHHRNPETHYQGSDRLTAEGRSELKNSDFGIPSQRKFPMPDAEHVRAAESRFHFASDDEKPELARRIIAKAEKFGVDVESETIKSWAEKR